jgi:2-oxoglutarate dehydrogenase E2 component (dihydrolipoamide succinyltransferase)
MKVEIKVPAMGESISEASIGSILKASGSYVHEGEEIIELETEKVNQVLYAPCNGVVNWSISQGATVSVGEVIGYCDSEAQGEVKKKEEAPKEEKPQQATPPPAPVGQSSRMGQKEFVADLFKEPKKEPKSKKKDVEKAQVQPVEKEGLIRRKMSRIRKTIATRLVHSLHESAMLTTFNEVDMSQVLAMREKYKEIFLEKHGVKLGFTSFFVKAVIEALKEFPDFNSFIDGEDIVQRTKHDIGIAVSTDRGLVVPVIRDCDTLSFAEIEKEVASYAAKARNGKLAITDLEGGGFTITNGGVFGSMLSTPILNPPQVGILGMHKIMKRAVVVDDEIVIRPMMYLALSYDHRIVDGKEAVVFLVRVKEVLEDPSRLMFIDNDSE